MADMFDVLRIDHRETVAKLDRLLVAPHWRSEQLLRVNELTQEVVIGACKHEAIEEIHVWPAVRRTGEHGAELAAAGLAQEQDSRWVLDRINGRHPEDPGFDDALAGFSEAVREHIRFEEEEVWPWLASFVTLDEREMLGEELERSRQTAPTRPHPAGFHSAGALRTIGVATGLLDRARDAFTGRGQRFENQDS